ncbi:hypothetical protein HDV57DRAFT_193573 [Trichoderma longibrachiatum]|uniref:Uncharacterized protein n=1 Tax=Trichoderma longibrachiatum ATCC 18648 TaxID=983965 RepID=A0A2T4C8W2_TRILO|nr:hypothetical protein M440DRAFT_297165 [Trichoderma longibrachiatum ATCC 18648]
MLCNDLLQHNRRSPASSRGMLSTQLHSSTTPTEYTYSYAYLPFSALCVVTVPNRIASDLGSSKSPTKRMLGHTHEVMYLQGLARRVYTRASPRSPCSGRQQRRVAFRIVKRFRPSPEGQGLLRSRVRMYTLYCMCDIPCISIIEGHLQLAKSMLLAVSECNATIPMYTCENRLD